MNLNGNTNQICEDPRESLAELERKIDSITKTLSRPYFNKILKDLLKSNPANAKTIVDYIIAEQTEINIKDLTKEGKIKILVWLSNFHKNSKSFTELTKQDILEYLNTLRKSSDKDPSNKWIGTYNGRQIMLLKFFKWLYGPDEDYRKRSIPICMQGIRKLPIVTIVVVFIPFFIQAPLLDYGVLGIYDTDDPNVKYLEMYVRNYGLVTANNVIISVNSDKNNTNFLNFTLTPFLPNSTSYSNNGSGAIIIDSVPPRAENTMNSFINSSNTDINLTTYVRSDESVGYHDTFFTIAIYAFVLMVWIPLIMGKLKFWKFQ